MLNVIARASFSSRTLTIDRTKGKGMEPSSFLSTTFTHSQILRPLFAVVYQLSTSYF